MKVNVIKMLVLIMVVSFWSCTLSNEGSTLSLSEGNNRTTPGLTVDLVYNQDWSSEFSMNLYIRNNTTETINGWTVTIEFQGNEKIEYCFGGKFTQVGNIVTITDVPFTRTIPSGNYITVSLYGRNLYPGIGFPVVSVE